ncbi:BrnA antitoxin of type II toxin-antitoxin system [Lachnospiraceae bacterium]|nr:BrnA antitoxin of type II toxin-antitoxin system [Lachnospiraceae bacterium]
MKKDMTDEEFLEKEFDFSKAIKNPYANRVKRTITINIDNSVYDYFKDQSKTSGIPYQTLINMYLLDCVQNHRELDIQWK